MSWVCRTSSCSSRRHSALATALSHWGGVLLLLVSTSGFGYDTPRNLQQGWDGNVEFGALATFGQVDSSAVLATTRFTYSSNNWEHELDIDYHRSVSEALVARRDDNGEIMRDANDKEIQDRVRSTTNNRRFIGGQIRWFFRSRYFLFAITDLDTNTPADLEKSTRYIGGVGYKLYRSKTDLISAGVGFGRKKRVSVLGDNEEGGIAYFGLHIKREVGDKLVLGLDLTSDFNNENRYSEAELSVTWKLRDPIALKLKYAASFNSAVIDPLNTFDDGLEAALSLNLAFELF